MSQPADPLLAIFREVLGIDDLQLTGISTFEDVPSWDSIAHVDLIAALEDHYHLKFTTVQIMEMNNVESIRKVLAFRLRTNPA